jgi:hypothetical protein
VVSRVGKSKLGPKFHKRLDLRKSTFEGRASAKTAIRECSIIYLLCSTLQSFQTHSYLSFHVPHASRARYSIVHANMGKHRKNRLKKSLNVDSPSFTPTTLSVPGKGAAISSQAATAAPFTPRGMASGRYSPLIYMSITNSIGTATPNSQLDAEPAAFNPAAIREFTPQNYDLSQAVGIPRNSS